MERHERQITLPVHVEAGRAIVDSAENVIAIVHAWRTRRDTSPNDRNGIAPTVADAFTHDLARMINAHHELIVALKVAKDRLATLDDADEATDADLDVLATVDAALRLAEGGA